MINIQHIRNGVPVEYKWGIWHLQVLCHVIELDHPELKDSYEAGCITIQREYIITDPSDGEVLTVKPGDEINIWYGC